MSFLFDPPKPPALRIAGTEQHVPVRRIFCVGRNYADHAKEMGIDPATNVPFFFCKPADALMANGSTIPYAQATKDLQFEIELVSVIGSTAKDISTQQAYEHVFGYAVGLDMTRRDLQTLAKQKNQPWDMGKGFDDSAPCSDVVPASRIGHPREGRIWLRRNGETVQDSDLANQIWQVDATVALLSTLVTLQPGDLIFHGTPEGVGPVVPGDRLQGSIAGVGEIEVRFGPMA